MPPFLMTFCSAHFFAIPSLPVRMTHLHFFPGYEWQMISDYISIANLALSLSLLAHMSMSPDYPLLFETPDVYLTAKRHDKRH